MLDGREREIDIEVGPAKVMGARSLHRCDLPYRGVREPPELLERHQQVAIVDVQPEPSRGDLANLDESSHAARISSWFSLISRNAVET